MSSLLLPYLFCVVLRLFLHVVRFGARRLVQQSVPHRRGQVSHHLMRLDDGLEHDLVETLRHDLAVPLGLGYSCRRAAGPSFSPLGSPDGASKLPSRLLSASAAVPLDGSLARLSVQILSVACGVWVVEQAGHVDSLGSSVMGKANESGAHAFANLQILARRGCN